MYDVIECFQAATPNKQQTRQIVFQTPNKVTAQSQADRLWQESTEPAPDVAKPRVARSGASTFVVVDRSTAAELYRVPAAEVAA